MRSELGWAGDSPHVHTMANSTAIAFAAKRVAYGWPECRLRRQRIIESEFGTRPFSLTFLNFGTTFLSKATR